jgi:hypothetical protein
MVQPENIILALQTIEMRTPPAAAAFAPFMIIQQKHNLRNMGSTKSRVRSYYAKMLGVVQQGLRRHGSDSRHKAERGRIFRDHGSETKVET